MQSIYPGQIPFSLAEFHEFLSEYITEVSTLDLKKTTWKGRVSYEYSNPECNEWVTWDLENGWRYGDSTGSKSEGCLYLRKAIAECKTAYLDFLDTI